MNRLSPKLQVPEKVKIRRIFKLISRVFWTIIAIILLYQMFRLNLFLAKTTETNIDQASTQVEILQKDLDEIREYLLIPDSTPENDDSKSRNDQSLEQFLDSVLKDAQREEQKAVIREKYLAALKQTIDSNDFDFLTDLNLSLVQDVNLYKITTSDSTEEDPILTFGFDNSKLIITTPINQESYLSNQIADFSASINQKLTVENLQDLISKIESANQAKLDLQNLENETPADLVALLESKNLSLITDPKSEYKLLGTKSDGTNAFTISYNPLLARFSIVDENSKLIGQAQANLSSLLSNLTTFLNLNTFPTLIQKNVSQKLDQLQNLLNSAKFSQKLKTSNLEFEVTENESNYEIIFRNISSKNSTFSLLLDKNTAELFLISNGISKKVSFTNSATEISGQVNYLIAGKQGSLTDTLILANIDQSKKKVNLLSIPRDLYLDGKKINSIYASDGIEALTAKISSITGQKINNYLLIDMYAFIDVVDYLGGVQVYLDQQVVDPTYKTFDNGVWGTMYFAAGEHNLNGTQALRLARSRYTTSDFARAARQQMILAALKDQVTKLGFKDAKAISQIALTVYNKTETNLSLSKSISSFFKYKDFEVNSQNVLSTANILVSTYSNEYNKVACAKCGRGAYILVPKNNDWSLLKTYVSTVFNS